LALQATQGAIRAQETRTADEAKHRQRQDDFDLAVGFVLLMVFAGVALLVLAGLAAWIRYHYVIALRVRQAQLAEAAQRQAAQREATQHWEAWREGVERQREERWHVMRIAALKEKMAATACPGDSGVVATFAPAGHKPGTDPDNSWPAPLGSNGKRHEPIPGPHQAFASDYAPDSHAMGCN
ncbi:MAG: hypothetical protein M1546_15435, partial [Chloroflexi bacterium]|nr:hypothetical protein [Chloroflexota bacterium]